MDIFVSNGGLRIVLNIFICLLSQGDTGPPGARGNPGRDGKRVRIKLRRSAVCAES